MRGKEESSLVFVSRAGAAPRIPPGNITGVASGPSEAVCERPEPTKEEGGGVKVKGKGRKKKSDTPENANKGPALFKNPDPTSAPPCMLWVLHGSLASDGKGKMTRKMNESEHE